MILGFSCLNTDIITNVVPARQTFTSGNIYGSTVIDEVHLRNIEMSDSDILALNSVETFDANTLLLGHMENNLQMGNYTSLTSPINSYNIEKRLVGSQQYNLVQNVTQDSNITSIKDYTCKNKTDYEYAIFPQDISGVIGSSSTQTINSDFFGWFLISQDNTISYKFDMQINTDALQVVEDYKIFDNYTKYAVSSKGKRQYVTGKISTIPYSISTDGLTYVIDVNILNTIEDFIEDTQPKYLKNAAGQIFLVSTHGYSYKYYDEIGEQPYTISFQFEQIGLGE